jgi:hypothetical protein
VVLGECSQRDRLSIMARHRICGASTFLGAITMILVARVLLIAEMLLPYWGSNGVVLRAMGFLSQPNDVPVSDGSLITRDDLMFTRHFSVRTVKVTVLALTRRDRSRLLMIGCSRSKDCSAIRDEVMNSHDCNQVRPFLWSCTDSEKGVMHLLECDSAVKSFVLTDGDANIDVLAEAACHVSVPW